MSATFGFIIDGPALFDSIAVSTPPSIDLCTIGDLALLDASSFGMVKETVAFEGLLAGRWLEVVDPSPCRKLNIDLTTFTAMSKMDSSVRSISAIKEPAFKRNPTLVSPKGRKVLSFI